jgi:hypothetical protein
VPSILPDYPHHLNIGALNRTGEKFPPLAAFAKMAGQGKKSQAPPARVTFSCTIACPSPRVPAADIFLSRTGTPCNARPRLDAQNLKVYRCDGTRDAVVQTDFVRKESERRRWTGRIARGGAWLGASEQPLILHGAAAAAFNAARALHTHRPPYFIVSSLCLGAGRAGHAIWDTYRHVRTL